MGTVYQLASPRATSYLGGIMDKTHITCTVLRLALLAIALQACLSLKIKCKRQRLEFCNFAGFRKTTATNLVEQGDQEQVALDQRFKNLKLLSQTGCSDLIRPFAFLYLPLSVIRSLECCHPVNHCAR